MWPIEQLYIELGTIPYHSELNWPITFGNGKMAKIHIFEKVTLYLYFHYPELKLQSLKVSIVGLWKPSGTLR